MLVKPVNNTKKIKRPKNVDSVVVHSDQIIAIPVLKNNAKRRPRIVVKLSFQIVNILATDIMVRIIIRHVCMLIV